jgi:hypothetical protein
MADLDRISDSGISMRLALGRGHVRRTLTDAQHVRKLLTFNMPKRTHLSARGADTKHVLAATATHSEPDTLTSPTVTGSKRLSPKHTTGLQDAGRSFRLGGRKITGRCTASFRGIRKPACLPSFSADR